MCCWRLQSTILNACSLLLLVSRSLLNYCGVDMPVPLIPEHPAVSVDVLCGASECFAQHELASVCDAAPSLALYNVCYSIYSTTNGHNCHNCMIA